MILKNNKIIIVLNVIMLLIVTGLSTYAYHKQKSYSNQKIEINNLISYIYYLLLVVRLVVVD